jgi:hypothetical protein
VLGVSLTLLGRPSEAEVPLRRALELRFGLDDPDSPWLAETRINLAEALLAERRWPEARALLQLAATGQARQPALNALYRAPLLAARRRLQNASPD